MQTLSSFVCGRWHEGTGPTQQLQDPTTEEVIACCSSAGIDFQGMLDHARRHGVPALQAMSFAERAAVLKALSAAIHEIRDELIELSARNGGSTRGDAKFDIDGATGTLAAYASIGKGLGERRFLTDGEGLQMGRSPRFWAQHVWVSRPGVAVHVNAFNFPTWGMGEKMACALLAGVPVIEKAGTPSAMVAWRMAQAIVDSGILPEGAFQFVVGRPGDLLDRLGPMDALAFTGSSTTGAALKANPGLLRNNTRVNIEADSVNAAVFAPDVEEGSDTWSLFLNNIVVDMTQKTGQKCTAVRRIMVPADRVDSVTAELVDRLQRIRVGDPRDPEVRMGPVASARLLADVRKGIDTLAAAGRTACGGSGPVQDRGFFVAPTLLVAASGEVDAFHTEEVFGPVATVIGYDGSAAEAIALCNRGGGSLVASIYGNDRSWTDQVTLGIGPWHGRVWVASDRVAEQAFPPGMVMPTTVHGGPGRAGGGEELGGLRGLQLYMQRVAVQGFQGAVAKSFGAT